MAANSVAKTSSFNGESSFRVAWFGELSAHRTSNGALVWKWLGRRTTRKESEVGLFDLIGDALKAVGTSPQTYYLMGKSQGKDGEMRKVFNLGRDDGSEEWETTRACIDAYNRGYDDGRFERDRD
jgi:hypothetical protein